MDTVLVLLSIFLVHFGSSEHDATYYTNLWNDRQDQMIKYTRPTRNEEFSHIDPTNCIQELESFEYIIVGAGSTGCTLANRLSNFAKVLLIEAGGDETDWSLIPGAFFATHLSELNWGYLTTPQKYGCYGAINRQCDATRGKVLGGCSAVNAMLHSRGNKLDFDNWASMGNTGWDYKNILRYFKRSERIEFWPYDGGYHGHFGPLVITHPTPKDPYSDTLMKSGEILKERNYDYNGKNQFGVSIFQKNIKDGKRNSVNQAYLQPILKRRRNLKVLTRALVTKINFDGNVARGLNYLHQNSCYSVEATREVIISAGAINSPQLLMLSGIGPASELSRFNITPVAILPVGQALNDHVGVFSIMIHTNKSIEIPTLDEAMKQYVKGRGWMTYTGGLEVIFLKSNQSAVPIVEVMCNIPPIYMSGALMKKDSNQNDDMDDVNLEGKPTDLMLNFVLLHGKSVGKLTLQSSDPIDFPYIDPNYLSHPDDIENMYNGIQQTLLMLDTEPFRAINATLQEFPIDACCNLSGKEKWYCIIRYKLGSTYHFSSTCRMGTNSKTSVVSPDLKVHGIERLRVADISVTPNETSGHMNSVAVMIGEKLAEEISPNYIEDLESYLE